MRKNNDSENLVSENFITERSTSGNLNFKVNSHLTEQIYGRRNSQYIAGEIIAIFSIKDDPNHPGSHRTIINTDIKAYYLIISDKFKNNYLVCPVFSKPLLECANFEPYETNLGIVPELSNSRMMYADVSRSHFVNKKEFRALIELQGNLLEQDTTNYCLARLPNSKLRQVIKIYKTLLN